MRKLGIGIAGAVFGMSSVPFIPLTVFLTEFYEWRKVLMGFSIISLLTFPIGGFILGNNYNANTQVKWSKIVKKIDINYLILIIGSFINGFSYIGYLTYFFVNSAGIGFTKEYVAMILSINTIFSNIGQIISGSLSSKLLNKKILAGIYALKSVPGIIFTDLIQVKTMLLFYLSPFIGISFSSELSHIINLKILDIDNTSILWAILIYVGRLGGFIGKWSGEITYDFYRSYDYFGKLIIILNLFASAIHLLGKF